VKLFHVVQVGDPATKMLLEERALGAVLISYAYHRDLKRAKKGVDYMRAQGVKSLLLDCGAFTAKSSGIKISLWEYERAISVLEPDFYVQLDVIGDPARTRKNLHKMQRDGFDPIPIFTRPTPLAELDALIREGYQWIALGNLNNSGRVTSLSGLRNYLNHVFALAQTRTRLHMFGIARVNVLLQFPFYSCDTSEALKATGYGVVRELRRNSDGRSVASHMPHRDPELALRYPHLADYAVDGNVPKSGNRKARLRHNARNLDLMAEHVTRVWEMRGIHWENPTQNRPKEYATHKPDWSKLEV
jgi:hypothetical protein